MSESRRRFVIGYDIVDDRRRDAIARALSGFGDRIQFSVFVVDARPAQLVRMKRQLEAIADLNVDSLLYCDLGLVGALDRRRFDIVGRQRPMLGEGPLVI